MVYFMFVTGVHVLYVFSLKDVEEAPWNLEGTVHLLFDNHLISLVTNWPQQELCNVWATGRSGSIFIKGHLINDIVLKFPYKYLLNKSSLYVHWVQDNGKIFQTM